MRNAKKMTKHTLKILRYPYRTIFNVCLIIFQHYFSVLDFSWKERGMELYGQ